MSARSVGQSLGRRIARTLRLGTLVAVTAVAAGYLAALQDGSSGLGGAPLPDALARGGADAIILLGLLGLTVLPLAVLGVAAVSFAGRGERRYLLTSLVTLVLLVASLVTAAAVALAS